MKFRILIQSGKVLVLASMLMTTACQKDISKLGGSESSDATAISDSSTVADNAYNDVFVNAYYSVADNPRLAAASAASLLLNGHTTTNAVGEMTAQLPLSCAIYTVDTTATTFYPVTVTMDFGTDGCTSSIDGLKRQGKIIYTFSSPLLFSGGSVTAVFDHYYVNGYGLQGSCTLLNTTPADAQGELDFNSQITNGIFSFPSLTNFHYSHNKTIKITLNQIFNPLDDVYTLTGNSNFTASDGSSLVLTVTTPLTRAATCAYIGGGVVSFVYSNDIDGTIDFGDGSCDNSAQLTIGSSTTTITLR